MFVRLTECWEGVGCGAGDGLFLVCISELQTRIVGLGDVEVLESPTSSSDSSFRMMVG